MNCDWILIVNTIAWVTSNILVAYIALVLFVFVIGYYVLFDPRATTAGKFIYRFSVSLIGVIGLVFISLFVDPSMGKEWFVFPEETAIWRPIVRLVSYAYVSYSVTALTILLVLRKWWPDRLRTSRDKDLVKIRFQNKKGD